MKCPKCHSENPETARFCLDCGTQFGGSKVEAPPPGVSATLQMPIRELTTGSTFAGRYQVIEELGHGGMGRVYKVLDSKIGEKIALKLIRPEVTLDKETIDRFSNELKLARKIRHKNVCQMFDLGEANGTHFITMEYVHGEDLKQLIRKVGRLSARQAVLIANQVCEGLEEAHRLGIVHRDLKPQNIMIDEDGHARIMDFGIARSLKARSITGAGVMIGTPEYMSPEQVEGKDIDPRSDIYSLGVILYEMMTGRVPFEGETPFTIGVKHKSEIPKNPKELNAQLPDGLNHVILKCLEKERDKRYQSAGELGVELGKIEGGIPTAEKAIPRRKPFTSKQITVQFSVKRLFIPGLILIGLVIAGFLIWKFFPRKEAPAAPKIENSIAVISFENLTGDKSLDDLRKAIPNLLIVGLEQTGRFYVATWERLNDLLKQMGKSEVDIIGKDLGFELCRREGIKALVLGTFTKAGNMFATEVKVLDVDTKQMLKSASSTGEGIDSILRTQIDALSREISKGIGGPAANVEAAQTRVAEVTTDSMEAYNYFIKGSEELGKFYYESARQSLEKAVELDPTFATAYLYLASANGLLGNTNARLENYRKAKEYSEKATTKEKLFIQALYARAIDSDLNKCCTILTDLTRRFPKEKQFHFYLGQYCSDNERSIEEFKKAVDLDPNYGNAFNGIAYVYVDMKNYQKALEYFNKYASVSPNDANPIDSIASLYFTIGKIDEAVAQYEKALAIKPDFILSLGSVPYLYALKQDYGEAMRRLDRMIAVVQSPGRKSQAQTFKGFYYFWLGSLDKCLSELQRAEDAAKEVGNEARKAWVNFVGGWAYFDSGQHELNRKHFKSWLDLTLKIYPDSTALYKASCSFALGLTDIKEGQIDASKSRLGEIKSFLPTLGTSQDWGAYCYSFLRTEILLAEGSVGEAVGGAIDVSKKAASMIAPLPEQTDYLLAYNMPPLKDLLARAYQKKGDLDRAIAEYEKLITFDPKSESRFLVHPLYYYRLAKLYEQKGVTTKAQEHFKRFLDLWKDADPGRPEVEDAKSRLSALKIAS